MTKTNGFYVYSFQHDDDMQGWKRAETFQMYNSNRELESLPAEVIAAVQEAMKACGWEGDGGLDVMAVPPIFFKEGDNYWSPVFHAKQSNNGISWIACERELGIDNLYAEAATRRK